MKTVRSPESSVQSFPNTVQLPDSRHQSPTPRFQGIKTKDFYRKLVKNVFFKLSLHLDPGLRTLDFGLTHAIGFWTVDSGLAFPPCQEETP